MEELISIALFCFVGVLLYVQLTNKRQKDTLPRSKKSKRFKRRHPDYPNADYWDGGSHWDD